MISNKIKIRVYIATIIFVIVSFVYLITSGIIFPGYFSFTKVYEYTDINMPDVSNLEEVRIAFFGDQGINDNSKEVLELVKEKDVDLIVLLGDFDYVDSPEKFKEMYEEVYGEDNYPLLSVVGNHDVFKWSEYKRWMSGIDVDNLNCEGEYGEAMVCNYGPVSIILSAIGTLPGDHVEFLENTLPRLNNSWNICAWHKNNQDYQIGGKETEVDMKIYSLCSENNALIVSAHEHSYSRTHGLSDIDNFIVGDDVSPYNINDSSIIVVSGLGGKSARKMNTDTKDIWSSTYSKEDGAVAGALICDFIQTEFDCEFINIERDVIDEFKLVN